ncbi:uncharacterized protein FPRO_04754 [Fusarium proliferatum ET1]|uniref:Uncharacterized protein n=1 Tax=Fusarium proliferatum (strain ET1) TaxID=1227346 RepID=A0A1L7VGV8_FUSPR|nr:uncharacterized protein FPRO_04754 [Fusarium proliferatum ET1]CZR39857.1 uncharacterized protein FPRO_04754 [Fusarium proliferatum ET1]
MGSHSAHDPGMTGSTSISALALVLETLFSYSTSWVFPYSYFLSLLLSNEENSARRAERPHDLMGTNQAKMGIEVPRRPREPQTLPWSGPGDPPGRHLSRRSHSYFALFSLTP